MGDESSTTLESEDLIRIARAEDHQVTDRMLETFRGQHLLPRPERAANRGRRPVWNYPPGTQDQLLSLLRWRERTKDPHTLRVLLWLDGYPVPIAAVREGITTTLDTWMTTIDEALARLAPDGDRDAAVATAAATLAGKRGKNTVLPRGARLTTAQRTDAAELMLRGFLLGEETNTGEGQALMVEKALGLGPGRRDRVAGAGPWLTGPAAALFDASRFVSMPALAIAVREADDQALEAARTTTTALFHALPLLARLVTATAGQENLAGLGGFGRLDENPEFVHLALAMVIALQRAGEPMADNMQQVTDSLAGIPALADSLDRLLEMPHKQVTANLASLPPAERGQAQRLIGAASDGDHRRSPDRPFGHGQPAR
nr:hypothetical protein KPHV_22490 [Kitasatospora purpeofusca]